MPKRTRKIDLPKRIAIVDTDRCKPHKCRRECEKFCPVNAQGKMCVTHSGTGKAEVSEISCTGCNICTKKCPFRAITIVNLPSALGSVTHRYSANGFQLYGLPMPERECVLGMIGANGCGKTTALLILIGEIIPNLGDFRGKEKSRRNLNLRYRGTNVQNYLKELDGGLKIGYKSQNIQPLRERNVLIKNLLCKDVMDSIGLTGLEDRTCEHLSDGELQRVAIGMTLSSKSDIMVFDEPCTYLDIFQRMKVARLIRESNVPYKIVIEHDFTALDYMADKVCLLYGAPAAYGNVTLPMSTGEGLNCFLDGYITYSNTRFRSYSLDFKFSKEDRQGTDKMPGLHYPDFSVSYQDFTLTSSAGSITQGTVTVLLGPNGSGKTTFIRSLAGQCPANGAVLDLGITVSYKEQNVYINSTQLVRDYLLEKTCGMILDPNFRREIFDVMNIDHLMDRELGTLSGGEMQKISLVASLGKPADLYLIDEPSCYLDVESVLIIARMLKRFAISNHKYMFVVEHDFNLGLYLADDVLLFDSGFVSRPLPSKEGFNLFLRNLDVTMRRDHDTLRPRINKPGSQNDITQKLTGDLTHDHIDTPHTSFAVPDLSW